MRLRPMVDLRVVCAALPGPGVAGSLEGATTAVRIKKLILPNGRWLFFSLMDEYQATREHVLYRLSALPVASCSQADCSGSGWSRLSSSCRVSVSSWRRRARFRSACPYAMGLGAAGGRGEQAGGPGALHGLAAAVRAELAVQVSQVGLDRVRGQEQLGGDLWRTHVGGQVAQHAGLADGEWLAGPRRRPGRRSHGRGRGSWCLAEQALELSGQR